MSKNKPYIGGQAVIEGVMMRGPTCMSVAVRRPDDSIIVREAPITSRLATSKLWKLPGLRGVVTLFESFSLGYRALHFSAESQLTEEEKAEMGDGGGKGVMLMSTLFALGLFIALPQAGTWGLGKLIGIELDPQSWQFHAVTGGFKLLVLTIYLGVISRVPDVRRTFQYHGAEHKTIFAYEAGLDLTVPNVQSQSTLHPRCGTTFLIVVVMVSIVLGSIVTPLLLGGLTGWPAQIATLAIRIALLPFIASVSYELQRFTARYCTTGPLQVLLWPGFLFQKITTREPEDAQVEIAITAMQAAMWRERNADAPVDGDLEFDDFDRFQDEKDALRPLGLAV